MSHMTNSVSGNGLQGANWSIERGLVKPSIAEAAGLEILGAIATEHPMLSFDYSQPEHGYAGYLINGLDDITKKDISAPGFCFSSLLVVRDALTSFKDPELLEDVETSHYHQGMVNILEPGGRVPSHRDGQPWSLVFVTLTAKAKAKIRGPGEGDYTTETLRPGDALVITNPKSKGKRPKHKITNHSRLPRVSYGEYTTQRRK